MYIKKTLNCEHHGYSFKNLQKLGKMTRNIFFIEILILYYNI